MTEADYYMLIIEHINLYNATFEFWLSITFAFIAVFHFASDALSGKFLKFLVVLYLAASILFIARFVNRVLHFTAIYRTMEKNSVPLPPWNYDFGFGFIILAGMFVLMICGTIGSIYYASTQSRTGKFDHTIKSKRNQGYALLPALRALCFQGVFRAKPA